MKKLFSIILFLVIILSGCSESFLDREPEDTLAPGIFFKTPADIKTGLIAFISHPGYLQSWRTERSARTDVR